MGKSLSNVDKIVEIFTISTAIECKNLLGIAKAILKQKLKSDPVEKKRFDVSERKEAGYAVPKNKKSSGDPPGTQEKT